MDFGLSYSNLKLPNCAACGKEIKQGEKMTADRKDSKYEFFLSVFIIMLGWLDWAYVHIHIGYVWTLNLNTSLLDTAKDE